MVPADEIEFVKALNGLAALKPHAGGKLTTASIELYWLAMQDWSIEEFKAGAVHLLKHHPYQTLPGPGDFEKLRKAGEPIADEAWNIVLSGAPLPPGSRMERAAATLGGQQSIRHEDVEKSLPFTRNKFIEVYDDLTKVDPVRDALPQIAAHGTRAALSAPKSIASFVPIALTQRTPAALPAPAVVATVPKVALPPPKSARAKITALLPLPQFDDEAIAKISGETVEFVRQVRAEQECVA